MYSPPPDPDTERRMRAHHARLRLARQRTGPTLVRARTRAEPPVSQPEPEPLPEPESTPEHEPEPEASWWRRIAWAHVGAVVGALAAIGGLIFTGVATYYSAAVAEDQLQQSNEAEEHRSRDQASRVWLWVDRQRDGKQRVHLTNRSPDPVSQVFAEFITADSRTGRVPRWGIYFHTLPPCSDLVFSQDQLWYDDQTVKGADWWDTPHNEKPGGTAWHPMDGKSTLIGPTLMFVDRDGTSWARHDEGQLDRAPLDPSDGIRGWRGIVVGQPVAERAQPCDDTA